MKQLLALGLAGTIAVSVPYGAAWADNTDQETVTVNGQIVAALELTVANNLVMPHIVKPTSPEPQGQVTLTCDPLADTSNGVSYTNRSNPFADGNSTLAAQGPQSGSSNIGVAGANSTGTCATINVSGQPNYFAVVTIGAPTGNGGGINFSAISCNDALNNTVGNGSEIELVSGSLAVRCGGTVSVSSAASTGIYSGRSFQFAVTYD
jgi:hypothetical protein